MIVDSVPVGPAAEGLDDVDILTTDAILYFASRLAARELLQDPVRGWDPEKFADAVDERWVGVAAEDDDVPYHGGVAGERTLCIVNRRDAAT